MEAPASVSACGLISDNSSQYTEILHFTLYGLYNYLHGVVTMLNKKPRVQKGEANQKQQLSDYIASYI